MIPKTRAVKKVTPVAKTKYVPNKGEATILSLVEALRSGDYPKLKSPCIALRGTKGEYSVSGVLCELIRKEYMPKTQWESNDTTFKTYTIDGYAFELPMWAIAYLTSNGLAAIDVIALVDLCYDLEQNPKNTFESSASSIEQLVRQWLKDKSADVSITDAEWDEIYLVGAEIVDLSKGKLTASDWKKITQAVKAKSTDTTVGTWRGFMGRLAKKLGPNGERAATQYKQVPSKVLTRVSRLRSNFRNNEIVF